MATLSRHTAVSDDSRQRNEQTFLDATTSLLDEGIAFADLGVGQISQRAGFSRPTFYAHFRDKRELLLTLGAGLDVKVHAVAEPWLRREGDASLRETLAAVAETFRENSAIVGALVEAATYDTHVAEFWRSFHDLFVQLARDRALEGDPSLAPEVAEARAFALVWMTERAFTENIASPRVDDEALLDALEGLWRSAIVVDD
jgi:AcrR family transcriptional regulator